MSTISNVVEAGDNTKLEQKNSNNLAERCATTGMIGSLGATVFSGIGQGKIAHLIHPWAGMAFVGFALWHTYLKSKGR